MVSELVELRVRLERASTLEQTSSLLDARVERSDISGLFQSFKSLYFLSGRFELLPALA